MSMMWVCALTKVCSMSLDDDALWRVCVDPDTNSVEVLCIGMNRVDNPLADTYFSVDHLPQWVQEKLALLMLLEPAVPERDEVGDIPKERKVNQYTFWISKKKGAKTSYLLLIVMRELVRITVLYLDRTLSTGVGNTHKINN